MRREILAWRGFEVKTQGDSFMISFSSATDAVQFACSVQLALLTQDWPSHILDDEVCAAASDAQGNIIWRGLRVRMGIHFGEPTLQLKGTTVDYFGPMVNVSARVESRALGGQILITEELREQYMHSLPPAEGIEVQVLEKGLHHLKGVAEPRLLWQLHPVALSSREFPPPKNLSCDRCQMELSCPKCDASPEEHRRHASGNRFGGISRFPSRLRIRKNRANSITSQISARPPFPGPSPAVVVTQNNAVFVTNMSSSSEKV
eukprot:TRINITY_DN5131_c0_g1_i1.p1 TRINITY_DN5131_c0_g1~~TRINITY_DN5131_c0_g1_i1.p1  ORF type:complete len:307 (-),score=38.23 TRINITY_DN5131_c0_g1_i1:20-802(-)